MNFSQEPLKVESIRAYIIKGLDGRNIQQKKTVEKSLQKFGQDGVRRRIDDHVSYWKNR